MASTPNFAWPTPDDTDPVGDGALDMRTLGNSIDSTLNPYPRGRRAYVENTGLAFYGTTEGVTLTAPAFTAVSGRYYRFTYFEPAIQLASGTSQVSEMRIRRDNTSGTVYAFGQQQSQSATQVTNTGILQTVVNNLSGSYTLVATMKSSTGGPALFRSGFRAFLLVEDLGL